MKLFIKNMVCSRCIMVVEQELRKMGYVVKNISLGEAEIENDITQEQKNNINTKLLTFGFELIDDRRSKLITQIKSAIIELLHQQNLDLETNLSDYLAGKIHHDYNYISGLFSEVEGTTIEKYFIALKIERVKELLVYDELSLSEIAGILNYSSVAHLSNQFKKITGLTPRHFRKIKTEKRLALDEV